MREITAKNAADYLIETGRLRADDLVEISELSGGVSNVVLLVRQPGRDDFVLKQARAQLRVPQPWFCGVERVLREIDVLKLCQRFLAERPDERQDGDAMVVHTPQLLFEDRDNFLFAMTAAPIPHSTWKDRLLIGDVNLAIAVACGRLLGRLHAGTWHDQGIARQLDDRQFFDALRIDPYYRQIARVHEPLRPAIERLIESVWRNRLCLVHGDFSPKNLLVWDRGLMPIDFEVGHFGDPAFDLGFFFTHLVLKSFRAGLDADRYLSLIDSFWEAYTEQLVSVATVGELRELESRTAQNLGGCLLARVDGKSRVDYIVDAKSVRGLARALFDAPSGDWGATMTMVGEHVRRSSVARTPQP